MDRHRQVRDAQRLAGVGFDLRVGLGPGIIGRVVQVDHPLLGGAFVACQTDRGATLESLLQPLAPSLVASRRALLAGS